MNKFFETSDVYHSQEKSYMNIHLLGDSKVGKTSVLNKYCTDKKFKEAYSKTKYFTMESTHLSKELNAK